jgi:hypothetical protein
MGFITLQTLPVEIIAAILSLLDVGSLIQASSASKHLRLIASDPLLNPWRAPILSIATAHFILFQATLPNLSDAEWQEAFSRRFLPSWTRWNRGGRWRETFMKCVLQYILVGCNRLRCLNPRILWKVWHRAQFTCTIEESWTDYILLHRNGTAEHCSSYSRSFDPLTILDELK